MVSDFVFASGVIAFIIMCMWWRLVVPDNSSQLKRIVDILDRIEERLRYGQNGL